MKSLGIFLIIGAIAVAAWFSINVNPDPMLLAVCLMAIFAGLLLTLRERATEIFVSGVGSVKAVMEQVGVDAREVTSIKHRIEEQGVTISMIAKEAEDAKALASDLREKNKEAEERIRTVNDALQRATISLRTVESTLEATKEYYSEAQLNMLGNPRPESELGSATPVARILEGTYTTDGNAFIFKTDAESEAKFREAVRKFPKFPFPYWYLSSALLRKTDPLWRSYALQAAAILEKTTLVPGHHPNHDAVLKQANAALAGR